MATGVLRAFALATLLTAVSATISVDLGIFSLSLFPSGCGRVMQIPAGATCESLAAAGGITPAEFSALNPLTLCLLPALFLVPNNLICVGDSLSFCGANAVTAQAGDTCGSLTSSLGGILQIGGGGSCSSLTAGTKLCPKPATNACAVDTICGQAISPDMQDLLGTMPEYCSLVKSCQGTLTTGMVGDKPSLKLFFTNPTPALQAIANTPKHPELQSFVSAAASGPAELEINFAPKSLADSGHFIGFDITVPSSGGRKMLATSASRYGMRSPCTRCYRR